ncbi:MAG TPA: hypothetical protein VH253_19025 [Phycisphaerae bacterium]|nr:hypothetical protein [Phycisphaerae bacterium]
MSLRILATLSIALLATFIIMFAGGGVSRPINQEIHHLGWFSDYLTSTYTFAPPSVTHRLHPLSLTLHLLTLAATLSSLAYFILRPRRLGR